MMRAAGKERKNEIPEIQLKQNVCLDDSLDVNNGEKKEFRITPIFLISVIKTTHMTMENIKKKEDVRKVSFQDTEFEVILQHPDHAHLLKSLNMRV